MKADNETDSRRPYFRALLGAASCVALATPSAGLAQSVETYRSGDFADPETWTGQIVPNNTTGGVVIHNVEVASTAATRFVTVESTLTILDGGALNLSEYFAVYGGKVLVNTDSEGAITVNPAFGSGQFIVSGCSGGEVEVAKGGIAVNPDPVTKVGGTLSIGRPCGNGEGATARFLMTSPDATVWAQNAGVSDFGILQITAGTMSVGTSFSIAPGGVVEITGDQSRFYGNRMVVEGSLSVAGGAQIAGTGTMEVRQGQITLDGPASVIDTRTLDFRIEHFGQFTVTRGATLSSERLSLARGLLRFEGADVTGSFTGEGAADFAITTDGRLEIADGADVHVATNARIYDGQITISSGGLLLPGVPLPEGAISSLTVAGGLDIDASGSLSVSGGGQITSASGRIEGDAYAELAGASSAWNISGTLSLPNSGGMATIALRDGASLTANEIVLDTHDSTRPAKRLIIGRDANNLMLGMPGTVDVAGAVTFATNGQLIFSHQSDNYSFDETLRSNAVGEGLIVNDLGTTILTGDTSQFSGRTQVTGGRLIVDNILGASRVSLTGGSLAGGGEIAGEVRAEGGTLLGLAGETLRMGPLTLSPAARIAVELGGYNLEAPAFVVNGSATQGLVLDGTLDVIAAEPLLRGTYRLIDFSGPLTDNGLELGTVPDGVAVSDLSIMVGADRVTLVNGSTPTTPFYYWQGGDGVITLGGGGFAAMDGQAVPLGADSFLIFGGAGGHLTASIADGPLTIDGIQFAATGYSISGGPLTISNALTPFRVGNGASDGNAVIATIAATIEGSGGIDKVDLGTLTLSGANLYTGGTALHGGTLAISGDAALGANEGALTIDGGMLRLEGDWIGSRTLTVGRAGGGLLMQGHDARLSGILSGDGLLLVSGGGALEYTGDGTAFAGELQFADGRLDLEGSLGGTLLIGRDAVLTGNGSFGDLTVLGTLAPGNSIGQLTGSGNLTFGADSVYEVELTAAGLSDHLSIAGTATLDGGTVRILALDPETDYTDGEEFTILTAGGGVNGTFTGIQENSAFLDFALGYDANTAFVRTSVVRTFPEVAVTFNEAQAASALAMLDRAPGSEGLAVYNDILMLDDGGARRLFNSASGEVYAAMLSDAAYRGTRQTHAGRSRGARGEGLTLWGGVRGEVMERPGDGNGAASNRSEYGFDMGIEYRSADKWAVGAGGGLLKGNLDLPLRASSAAVDGWHIGGYARHGDGGAGLTVEAGIDFARYEADVTRRIPLGDAERSAFGTAHVRSLGATLDIRYGIEAGKEWALGPAATFGYGNARLSALSETGADVLALDVSTGETSARRYGAGLFADWQGSSGSAAISVQYVADDLDDTKLGMTLQGASPTPFRIAPSQTGKEGAAIELRAVHALGDGWSLHGTASGFFSSGAHQAAASLRIARTF